MWGEARSFTTKALSLVNTNIKWLQPIHGKPPFESIVEEKRSSRVATANPPSKRWIVFLP